LRIAGAHQCLQSEAPAPSWKRPAWHESQLLCWAREANLPALHESQATALAVPEKRPCAQSRQTEAEGCGCHVPGVHCWHTCTQIDPHTSESEWHIRDWREPRAVLAS
jgi:hypothetical protein